MPDWNYSKASFENCLFTPTSYSFYKSNDPSKEFMLSIRDVKATRTANDPLVTSKCLQKRLGCEGKWNKSLCSYLQSAPLLVGQPVVGKKEEEKCYKQTTYSTRQLFQKPNCCVTTFHSPHPRAPHSSTLDTLFTGFLASVQGHHQRP